MYLICLIYKLVVWNSLKAKIYKKYDYQIYFLSLWCKNILRGTAQVLGVKFSDDDDVTAQKYLTTGTKFTFQEGEKALPDKCPPIII